MGEIAVTDRDETLPPFDDSRRALAFALNAHERDVRSPAANRVMAQGAKKAPGKAARRRQERLRKLAEGEVPPDVLEGCRRSSGPADDRREARERWLGMPRAAQAGLILREFGKLDPEQRAVLEGRLTRSHVPCSCGRPCCSGRAEVPRWSAAVERTCAMLRESMDVVRQPGKRGLSSHPELRRAVVRAHYMGMQPGLAEFAEMAGVSEYIAAKHRSWILEALARVEEEAWLQVDAMFDAAGITGTIIE